MNCPSFDSCQPCKPTSIHILRLRAIIQTKFANKLNNKRISSNLHKLSTFSISNKKHLIKLKPINPVIVANRWKTLVQLRSNKKLEIKSQSNSMLQLADSAKCKHKKTASLMTLNEIKIKRGIKNSILKASRHVYLLNNATGNDYYDSYKRYLREVATDFQLNLYEVQKYKSQYLILVNVDEHFSYWEIKEILQNGISIRKFVEKAHQHAYLTEDQICDYVNRLHIIDYDRSCISFTDYLTMKLLFDK